MDSVDAALEIFVYLDFSKDKIASRCVTIIKIYYSKG